MTIASAPLQVAPARDSIAVAGDVASIVVAIAIVVGVLMLGALWVRVYAMLAELRLSVRQNLGPVSDRARSISDNVEFITEVVRSDVASLNASVRALSDRLTLASERLEERIEEFNALMEIVQDEAEDIFLDTAATVRGVREGARSIAGGSKRGREPASGTAGRGPSSASPHEREDVEEEGREERALTGAEEGDGRPGRER